MRRKNGIAACLSLAVALFAPAVAFGANSVFDTETNVLLADQQGAHESIVGKAPVKSTKSSSNTYARSASSRSSASYDEQLKVSGIQNYDYAKSVVDLVNQERSKAGLEPLVLDEELTNAAVQRAAETALLFDHTRPDGEDCSTVSDKLAGENIAAGSDTPQEVMEQWMNSSGHKANILTPGYRSIGVGCFEFGAVTYWVQIFGTEQGTGSVPTGSSPVSRQMNVSYDQVPFKGSAFNLNQLQYDPEPLEFGDSYELHVGILNPGWPIVYCPIDAESFTWSSSDTSIATIGSDGVVHAQEKAGNVTITAVSGGGYRWSKNFTVSKPNNGSQDNTGSNGQGGTPSDNNNSNGGSNTERQQTVAMYRLYNPYTGEHFYTVNANERDTLKSIGWNDEGTGWTAPVKSKTPVYRLYNPYAPGGDHHYTMDVNEYNKLKDAGWRQEGIGWYSDDAKGTPLYRQYNPYAQTGTHNYTADKHENDVLVSKGWREEGVAWYGVK